MRTHQVFKFVLVGLLNTAFGYGIYALFISMGFHFVLAGALGTILSVLFNFKSTGSLVFGSTNNTRIFRFIGTYAFTYCFSTSGIWAIAILGFSPYIGGAIMLLPSAALSFHLLKKFVFYHE